MQGIATEAIPFKTTSKALYIYGGGDGGGLLFPHDLVH